MMQEQENQKKSEDGQENQSTPSKESLERSVMEYCKSIMWYCSVLCQDKKCSLFDMIFSVWENLLYLEISKMYSFLTWV